MDDPTLRGITAVILNWRTPDLTVRCARALIDGGMAAERIVVVDNGSPTGVEALRAALRGSRLVELSSNVGFARGNNAGAASAPGADAYLFVNSDAFLTSGGGLAALAGSLTRPDVGIVVPRLRDAARDLEPSVRPFPRPTVAALRATGLERLLPDGAQPRLGGRWSHARSRVVESATGAVMLVRASVWRALSGFDESTFMYGEDIDLCWRARRLGWLTWFCAEAEFEHAGGSSAALAWSDPERWERIGRAEASLVRRHLSPAAASITLGLLRTGLAAREWAWRLLGASPRAAAWRGLRTGYGHRP